MLAVGRGRGAEGVTVSAAFDRLIRADAVVVGSGIGGLTAALAMAPLRVVVVTKGDPGGGSTPWAQGGIAAAVARDDSPAEHAADTVAVGAASTTSGRWMCSPTPPRSGWPPWRPSGCASTPGRMGPCS